jgi:hypothetical protein
VNWDRASRKVPIDVRKVLSQEDFIEISFKDKVVKLPAWSWETVKPISASRLSMLRLCFYGKGIIEPWGECNNYVPKYPHQQVYCKVEDRCEYAKFCPKYQTMLSYIQ